MHSQLRGHQTLQRLVGKRRRLPTEGQGNTESSALGPRDISNGIAPPLSPEKNHESKRRGKEHTWVNLGGKENASSGETCASCPICGRSLPGADGAINAHIDACLARGSPAAPRPPKRTTQTTLAAFTSPKSKLGPGSKSLPASTSKGLTSSKTPSYNRSVSLPATHSFTPWEDPDLKLEGSPDAKRRKQFGPGSVSGVSKNGRGFDADETITKVGVSENASERGILGQVLEAQKRASEGATLPHDSLRSVERPGASQRRGVAGVCSPVQVPERPASGSTPKERGLSLDPIKIDPDVSFNELHTWAVGQWRFEDAGSVCAVGRPVYLVREPDNPKDTNAILVALGRGPKAVRLGAGMISSMVCDQSELQAGRRESSDGGLASFGRCEEVRLSEKDRGGRENADGPVKLPLSDLACPSFPQRGREHMPDGGLSKPGDDVSKEGGEKSAPKRASPRKRKGASPLERPKTSTPGAKTEGFERDGKKAGVGQPRVIGYVPVVIAEHLAPLMDQWGAAFEGEVTVLPQCSGASTGVRIRRPMVVGRDGCSGFGGLLEGRKLGIEERGETKGPKAGIGENGAEGLMQGRQGKPAKGDTREVAEGRASEGVRTKGNMRDESRLELNGMSGSDRQLDAAAFDISWRSACEAAARARAALVADPSLPKYQGNFLYLLRTVLDADAHLFSDEETALLRGVWGVCGEGQRLLVRLFQRKGPWFRLSSLSYADVQDLPLAVRELRSRGYLLSSNQSPGPTADSEPGTANRGGEENGTSSRDAAGVSARGVVPVSEGADSATGGTNRGEGRTMEGRDVRRRRRSQRLAATSEFSGKELPGKGELVKAKQQGQREREGGSSRAISEAVSVPRWDPRAPEMHDEGYVRDRVGVLNVGELRELLCTLGLKTKLEVNGAKRDELLRWIVAAACDAQQTTPWGQGCHVAVLEKVAELAGECVRLPERVQHLLWRVQRLFFLNGEQDLSAFLLVDMGVCKYQPYRCSRTRPVFRTRADLLTYEQALDVAQRMDEAVEAADYMAATRLLATARLGLDRNAPTLVATPTGLLVEKQSANLRSDGSAEEWSASDGWGLPREDGGLEEGMSGESGGGIELRNGEALVSGQLRSAKPGIVDGSNFADVGLKACANGSGWQCVGVGLSVEECCGADPERIEQLRQTPGEGLLLLGTEGRYESGMEVSVVQTATIRLRVDGGCHVSDPGSAKCTEVQACTIEHAQVEKRFGLNPASLATARIVDAQTVTSVEFTEDAVLRSECIGSELVSYKHARTVVSAEETVITNRRALTELRDDTPRLTPNPSGAGDEAPAPLFVARFAAGWVYSVVATVGVSILEKEKRYPEAVTVLRQLLGGNHSRGRRGQWWGRLSINLDHLGRKEESLEAAEAGVSDPWVRGGDRLALQRRVCRLSKPPRRWRKPHYSEAVNRLYSPSICPETRIGGRPLNCTVGAKSRFYGTDDGQCGVEELALQWYASEAGGGWRGVHSEGGVWCTLFGLLMWEVLFADVEDVFRTPFQTAPLDLDTDAFYPSREAAILERLRLIQTDDVASLLAVRWATSAGTRCRGVNWERHTLEELQTIAACVGNQGLAAVCRLLAEDHAGWAGGMPDLLLWRERKVGLNGVTLTEEEINGLGDLGESPEAGSTDWSLDESRSVGLETSMTNKEGGATCTDAVEGVKMGVQAGGKEAVDFWVKKEAKLVEVKGPRDRLSEQQRAWIGALQAAGTAVEVCKVVEEAEGGKKTKLAGKRTER